MADTYATVGQLEGFPVSDAVRGPLMHMRQVLDHLLNILAPHDKVRSYLDSISSDIDTSNTGEANIRRKKRRKVTFRTKIEYFANNHVADDNLSKAVFESTKAFDGVYNRLTRIHRMGKVDDESTKRAIVQGESLLQLWLTAAGKIKP